MKRKHENEKKATAWQAYLMLENNGRFFRKGYSKVTIYSSALKLSLIMFLS